MDNNFKSIVAQNIFYLRTQNQMTQLELGEKLNYSDKAISKWERGDSVPDAYVLKRMSELFGVTVDYILTEHNEQERKVDTKPARIAKAMLANVIMIGIATVALLVYIILAIFHINYWQIFIYAVPAILIVGIVFSFILSNKIMGILSVSGLVWSILLVVYFALWSLRHEYATWMILLLGIPIQLIVIFSFKMKISIKLIPKEPIKNKQSQENQTQVEEK
ncbi:MAG: helix-turn-helix transcriptional regulator [Clostridia bacterium]|nr:helix-turn-helix transcriptional regulator [Clostridia bacterium]